MTTKPPTTLPVASATAASETIRSQVGWPCCPATMIAPTMTIPWIAFVPDISGVCSSVGTFEITCTPRKRGEDQDGQLDQEARVHAGCASFRVTHAPAVISSSKSSTSSPSGARWLSSAWTLRA